MCGIRPKSRAQRCKYRQISGCRENRQVQPGSSANEKE
jgi:hypothetical protein